MAQDPGQLAVGEFPALTWNAVGMSEEEQPFVPYPAEWEAYVVLKDGSLGFVRPITPDDTEGIHRFHAAQSEESIYLRFFAPIKRLSDRDVYRFTHVDHDSRVALVVVVGLMPVSSCLRRHGAPRWVATTVLLVLVWAVLLFGTLSFLTFRDQLGKLFG